MADLLVREVGEETVRRLEERARAHGRSVEAESRAILEGAAVLHPLATAEGLAEAGRNSYDPADVGYDQPWTTTPIDIIDALQRGPLAEVDQAIWDDILNRKDPGRSFEW